MLTNDVVRKKNWVFARIQNPSISDVEKRALMELLASYAKVDATKGEFEQRIGRMQDDCAKAVRMLNNEGRSYGWFIDSVREAEAKFADAVEIAKQLEYIVGGKDGIPHASGTSTIQIHDPLKAYGDAIQTREQG